MPLGGGSYGVVIKASRRGRSYAIKAIVNEGNEPFKDLILRFKLETEILSRIDHPRIPGFVEAFSQASVHYLVQEYIEGLPLSYLVQNGYRFSEVEVKEIIYQLLVILKGLHNPRQPQNAVVHRDLRLSNLMLSGDKLYLIDFGMARFINSEQFPHCPDPLQKRFGSAKYPINNYTAVQDTPAHKQIPGPHTYQLLRQEISPRSDLFGVGVVAVDMFTNWVVDETLFEERWDEVLPLSEPFKKFIKKLLSRKGFTNSAEALEYLSAMKKS